MIKSVDRLCADAANLCRSVLQCWQCVAVHCSELIACGEAVRRHRESTLQSVAVHCSALQCIAVRCNVLQCVAVRCSVRIACGEAIQRRHKSSQMIFKSDFH